MFIRTVAESKTQRSEAFISVMCARRGGYEDLTREILHHFDRKPLGGRRETGEEHSTKLNFDVEVDVGVQATLEPPRQEAIPTVPPKKHSGSRHAGLKSAELLDAQHVRLPVLGNLTLVNAKTVQDAWEESRRTATARRSKRGDEKNMKNKTQLSMKRIGQTQNWQFDQVTRCLG